MSGPAYTVLFLCTGNAGRSILAEAILNRRGAPLFRAFSAGSHPKAAVNPHAVALLEREGYATDAFRPKSWDAFAGPGAPTLDFVITLCDVVADRECPAWPGRQPTSAHWSVPDPSAAGSDAAVAQAFDDVYRRLDVRIAAFCTLPLATLRGLALERRVRGIAQAAD